MMANKDVSGREDIEMLLPWFAAGTLSRRDAERVERALAGDQELASRFSLVREELAETIRLNETLGAPSARAMRRLFEKIDAEAPAAQQSIASAGMVTRIAERAMDFVASLSPRTLAWSASAAALAIILQAGVIAGVVISERAGQGTYSTASFEQPAVGAAAGGSFAFVRFAPDANAADIARFMEANKLTMAGGPTGGLYRVRVAATPLSKDELATAVKRLQGNSIVGFAAAAE